MDVYDVAVIGAGPAGSMAARYAALAGARTVIIEEHKAVGYPVQCAGLLGKSAVEEAELARPRSLMTVRGATVFSPLGSKVSFKAGKVKALVVDRRLFDRAMVQEAVVAGAELRLGAFVRGFNREHGQSLLNLGDGGRVRARVVISAEGAGASVARRMGVPPPRLFLSGAQVEAPFEVEDPEKVEVHLGAAPGLFAWIIPTSPETARIGLCTRERACRHLRDFLKGDVICQRLLGPPVDLVVGGLPMGPPSTTVADGILAVGDAAGQVKPTSGGGIYPGLICAKVAGEVGASAALEGDGSAKRLAEYDRLWRSRVGRELEVGMRINQMMASLDDEELEALVSYLARRPGILRVIEDHGDIDRPSLLIARLIPHIGRDGIGLARLLRKAFG